MSLAEIVLYYIKSKVDFTDVKVSAVRQKINKCELEKN